MRSHLTRNVYRRLLAGHGLLRPCPALSGRGLSHCRARVTPHLVLPPPPRRTFFGIFQKTPRQLKEPEVEPGYETLLAFRSMETENARPPPRDELVRGLKQFLFFKRDEEKAINPTQAFLIFRMLRYLLNAEPEEELENDISLSDLRLALSLVLRMPKGSTNDHLELARLLYEDIEWRAQALPEPDADYSPSGVNGDFGNFIAALCQYGGSLDAVACLDDYWRRMDGRGSIDDTLKGPWYYVLKGLAKEGREEELLRQYQKAEEAGIAYWSEIHEIMTTFFASRDRVEETKHWFEKPISGSPELPSVATYLEVARFSIRNGQHQWIRPIFERLKALNPAKPYWDLLFQWAVLGLDKGAEDLKQMMTFMEKNNKGQEALKPDGATIDLLLEAAIEKKNPYLAERVVSLGAELNIAPRSTTYILQMDYRLDAQDISGAGAIYQKLINGEVQVENREDSAVLNKYLRQLCNVEEPDVERVIEVTSELEHRRTILEPSTAVALCMLFLRTDQQYDVIDTLSLHTVTYSLEERREVLDAFVEYCLNRKTSTSRVWDGYSLLRQFFPETPPEQRIRLMDEFFRRKRPDMACHIFGHMRAHKNPKQHPTADVYVRCLEGIGRHPDGESLQMVHNMLKMDLKVQMNTRLWNALMLAYGACGSTGTALELWNEITNSPEGPSYNSLAIFFWVCENSPSRGAMARTVWQKMQRMDLDIPAHVFWSYCGAVAAQGHLEEVKKLIGGMEASVGYSPTTMT